MKKKVKQYSDDVKKKAVKDVLKGMSVAAAAKKHKVGRSTINGWAATETRTQIRKHYSTVVTRGKDLIKNSYSVPKVGEMIEVQGSTWKHPIDEMARKGAVLESSMRQDFDPINKPAHYADSKIEVIDYIEDKKMNYHLGNVIKYVSRAGRKTPDALPDLKKARWYLNREISNLEKKSLYVSGLDAYNADKKTE